MLRRSEMNIQICPLSFQEQNQKKKIRFAYMNVMQLSYNVVTVNNIQFGKAFYWWKRPKKLNNKKVNEKLCMLSNLIQSLYGRKK